MPLGLSCDNLVYSSPAKSVEFLTMRNFLKQNFLFVLGCLFGYSALELSFGDTFVRPYGSGDYAGGQKAVGAKVNAEFQEISDWLNGGNIDSTNLASGGIVNANIADATIAIGKLATSGLKVTSSSSAYSLTGIIPAQVTNLSTTLTTHGRPVSVYLEGAPATYLFSGSQTFGNYVAAAGNGTGIASNLFFVTDSATASFYNVMTNTAGGTILYPCSSFSYTDTSLSAGSHTFAVKVSQSAGNSSLGIFVFNCRLIVREVL